MAAGSQCLWGLRQRGLDVGAGGHGGGRATWRSCWLALRALGDAKAGEHGVGCGGHAARGTAGRGGLWRELRGGMAWRTGGRRVMSSHNWRRASWSPFLTGTPELADAAWSGRWMLLVGGGGHGDCGGSRGGVASCLETGARCQAAAVVAASDHRLCGGRRVRGLGFLEGWGRLGFDVCGWL